MIRTFALLAISMAAFTILVGCNPVAEQRERNREETGNPAVELVSKFEGCRVFKLWDGNERVYVANCDRASGAQWDTSRHVGKVIVRDRHQTLTGYGEPR